MTIIYILQLIDDKYYVGKTNNVSKRMDDHNSHMGSEWTKRYSPISILHVYENCDSFDEDKYTIKMMSQYGIENVRGGTYCRIHLEDTEIEYIKRQINGAQNRCFKCGSSEHWVRDCPKQVKKQLCSRCDRNNHTVDKCYAKTHKNGKSLLPITVAQPSLIVPNTHVPTAVQSSSINKYMPENMNTQSYIAASCRRCGRSNHNTGSCNAKTHIYGHPLRVQMTPTGPECTIL